MDERRTLHPVARSLLTATSASVVSIAAAALLGRLHAGRAAAPVNGPSQWLWGRAAAHRRSATLRHTALGYAIHHGSSWLWASVFSSPVARRLAPARPVRAAAVSVLAAAVDYLVVPRRFSPGFEAHLPRLSIAIVYAAFGAGLLLGDGLPRTPTGRSSSDQDAPRC